MSISAAEESKLAAFLGGGWCPGLAQTFDRRFINGTMTPASGVLNMSGIFLPAGLVVTQIVLFSAGVVTTNTHNWAALYQANLTFMAQSTDDTTSGDFAANTKITKTLTAAQTIPFSGLYYIGWAQASSGQNTLLACSAPASSIANNDTPICSATSTGSLTSAAPSPAGALTGQIGSFYAYIL